MRQGSSLRIGWFVWFGLSVSVAPTWAAQDLDTDRDPPYNVLFIAVDDMNDWVSLLGGHPQARTPNLEALARQGAMVFQNAHCPGPVCGPSRSALLSGFMPSRTGIYGNSQNMLDCKLVQDHPTLPEYFHLHGYETLSRGKIFHAHAGPGGRDRGQWAFSHWVAGPGGVGVDRSRLTSRDKNLIRGQPGPPTQFSQGSGSEFAWGPTRGKLEETGDYQTALWAANELRQPRSTPFFLAVGLFRPHLPFFVPQEFFDLYPLKEFQVPEYRLDDLNDILKPNGQPKFSPSQDFLWLQQNQLMAEAARAYLAALSYADACLGVILKGLEQSPQRERTIVIIWGDHGWHLGEKLRYRKATGWSESTRVPLIVRMPEMTQRQDCHRLVNLIDLYPTLVDLCGLPDRSILDGRSFKPLLSDPLQSWQATTVTIHGEGNASVRHERWRYIRYADGTEELYDLNQDPQEWDNLARSADPEVVQAMQMLRQQVPTQFAKGIPKAAATRRERGQGLDRTLKAKRRFQQE